MLAPRMHERYLYAALPVAALLAVQEPAMLLVLAMLSLSCLFNLAYVKHTLESNTQSLAPHDPFGAMTGIFNLVILAYSMWNGFAPRAKNRAPETPASRPAADRTAAQPRWIRTETIILAVLVGLAIVSRFSRLGHSAGSGPEELQVVTQARAYLRGDYFFDAEPPLIALSVSASMRLFGDNPWSWRMPIAVLGVALIVTTYLLGRRMFRSRLAAGLAATLVLIDGLFVADSRAAAPDIAYLSFAALSYLFLFRFAQSSVPAVRSRALACTGCALGLCLAAKLYAPVAAVLLVSGCIIYLTANSSGSGSESQPAGVLRGRDRLVLGALLLTGSVAGLVYFAALLPNYLCKPWGGVSALWQYHTDAGWFAELESSMHGSPDFPVWKWPTMLPLASYWQPVVGSSEVAAILAGAGAFCRWVALVAVLITTVRLFRYPDFVKVFVVSGYFACLVIWLPAGLPQIADYYLPSLYFSYLALGGVLSEWS